MQFDLMPEQAPFQSRLRGLAHEVLCPGLGRFMPAMTQSLIRDDSIQIGTQPMSRLRTAVMRIQLRPALTPA